MEESNINYNLLIKVNKDVADLVQNANYTPVVEILQDTTLLELTTSEELQYHKKKNATCYPTVTDAKGGQPIFIQDGVHRAGRFDINFSAPKPDTKQIWFAFQADKESRYGNDVRDMARNFVERDTLTEEQRALLDEEDEEQSEFFKPVKITSEDFGTAYWFYENGTYGHLLGDLEDYSIRDKDSIGIINDTKLRLFFWIRPKDAKLPPTFEDDCQAFEWLPGSGRIRLPATAGKDLKVKVWLEAVLRSESLTAVTFQNQTQKKMVIYKDQPTATVVMCTSATVEMGKRGWWDE
ncbi:hypothetical protein LTR92_011044 [Exophiala xenobiotica]|nr:hypothetical protein LTR92_011044 [Exophiala xenobiotica]